MLAKVFMQVKCGASRKRVGNGLLQQEAGETIKKWRMRLEQTKRKIRRPELCIWYDLESAQTDT